MELNHQTLNDELERIKFQHEIKVLEFEHEISRLKLENKKLKGEDKNKKYVELEKEIFLLKKRLEGLAAENTILLEKQQPAKDRGKDLKRKHSQTQVEGNKIPKPPLIKERLIEQGIARFIEGIEPETKIYASYVQWYNNITERTKHGYVHEYDRYFLIRRNLYIEDIDITYPNSNLRIFSYKSCKNENDFDTDFTTKTFDREWRLENIKCVLILHPKIAQKFEELHHMFVEEEKQIDENRKLKFHYWESKAINGADFSGHVDDEDEDHISLILCGILK